MTVYNFDNDSTWQREIDPQAAEVWTKATWDDAWTRRYDLIPTRSSWVHSPQLSTATLEYRYGEVFLPGMTRSQQFNEITARGYYVLIRWETDTESPISWLGFAESAVKTHEQIGDADTPTSGVQQIPCYGLEAALKETYLQTTAHIDPADSAKHKVAGAGVAATFNSDDRGNRSGSRVTFESGASCYVFSNPRDVLSDPWSTKDIVEYLMTFHLPTSNYGLSKIPWGVSAVGFGLLPSWDRPEVKASGRSVWDILNELLSTEKLMGWMVGGEVAVSSGVPVINRVDVVPFTRNRVTVSLPGLGTMLSNPATHTIVSTTDPSTEVQVDEDDSEVVDELIVQGPREVSVCSLAATGEFDPGWDPSSLTKYVDGPAGVAAWAAAWAAMKPYEKWEANAAWRSHPTLEDVYELFAINDNWDGTGGRDADLLVPEPVFYQDLDENGDPVEDGDGNEIIYVPYLGETTFLKELPLYSNVDYSKEIAEIDESAGSKMIRNMLMFERAPGVWAMARDAAAMHTAFGARKGNQVPLSISMKPDNDDGPAFRLKVSGGPKHAVSQSFVGNDGDTQAHRVFGDISYAKMRVTVAIEGDRRPAWTINLGGNPDVVRRKVITIDHAMLQHVTLAKGTIIGINPDGTFETAKGGTLRDPQKFLRSLAIIAGETYLTPRKSVRISTGRRIAGIMPGSIIQKVNGNTTDAIVREVKIEAPITNGQNFEPVRMSIAATTNEVDIVAMMGRNPVDAISRKLREAKKQSAAQVRVANRKAAISARRSRFSMRHP